MDRCKECGTELSNDRSYGATFAGLCQDHYEEREELLASWERRYG